ncbi:MAG TPA: 8-amino-7-oxononanoate synthase [Spirochaetota bacterium]|nr:8-amino-7-oxononanoate synthase [Spirochaetota bacterium]HOL58085.1 8-amino-7-oxononanoate synthase [Spirochaetota bacterium]HPP05534.1 8-amino-7-oxononanoate synthase [Spirochaetota bacterium]
MNNYWLSILENKIEKKKKEDSYRSFYVIDKTDGKYITINNKKLINFSSNNYLGLANDERIIDAGFKFAKEFGAGSGASRLVSGTTSIFIDLEDKIAKWVNKESALLFNSGYTANIGLLSSLADKNTVIFCDRLDHASIYDGIVQSMAIMERYRHNDIEHLSTLLEKYKDHEKKIVITDTVFSMDGDITRLNDIVGLKKNHNFLLIVDEAHSLGIFGKNGSGLVNQLNLADEVDIIMGTLGKSVGVFGAFVAGDRILIDYLINFCRSFIFTTAFSPFVVGAIDKSIDIIQKENRGEIVLKKAKDLTKRFKEEGIDTHNSETQIIPVITRKNRLSLDLMRYLMDNGIFTPAIRPPTVQPDTARVRLSLSYFHTDQDIEIVFQLIKNWFLDNKNLYDS